MMSMALLASCCSIRFAWYAHNLLEKSSFLMKVLWANQVGCRNDLDQKVENF